MRIISQDCLQTLQSNTLLHVRTGISRKITQTRMMKWSNRNMLKAKSTTWLVFCAHGVQDSTYTPGLYTTATTTLITRRAQWSAYLPHRPWHLTLTFQNSITSSPVAKGMTDEVWWQSDLNWRQEVVHKHTYIPTHISTDAGENMTSYHLRRGR